MARKTASKRGATIVVIAALAALVGPGVAAARPGKVSPHAPAVGIVGASPIASWAEDASWAEE